MVSWRTALAIGSALLVLILVIQNAEVVTVKLLFWEFQMSRVILILLAAAVGFLGGYVTSRYRSRSDKEPG